MDQELIKLKKVAENAALTAGKYIASQTREPINVTQKAGMSSKAASVVTIVDQKAQEIILNHLQQSIDVFDIGILAEESEDDKSRLEKDYFWCIDPLDGTLAFTEGRSGFAVSIALVSRLGDPVIGVVYDPLKEKMISCVSGQEITVSANSQDNDDLLHCYFDGSIQYHHRYNLIKSEIESQANQLGLTDIKLHFGNGAVLNAIGVLESKYGLYFKFPKLQKGGGAIWDFAATNCFFNAAGMQVSDIYGHKLNLNSEQTTYMNQRGIAYATNEVLHQAIIGLHKKLMNSEG